ncbi:MAG: hypothetical protein WC538_22590 [Thermoanaerobaculia bacterium]|jgi:hypothetical protein
MNRKSQRVTLTTPLKGRLSALPVAVIEIGPGGAGLEHGGAVMVGERHALAIDARHPLHLRVVVRHSILLQLSSGDRPAIYRTGVEFLSISEIQEALVDSILIDEAKEKVAEWEANLSGNHRKTHPALSLLPRRPHAFTWNRFVNNRWTTTATRDPNQPTDGFAVSDDEPLETVELLRKAYELYDENDRFMLRMMAQLAISERDHR